MEYGVVYVVLTDGELVYAAVDEESANDYVDTRGYEARQAVLNEWGNDDPSEKDLREAEWQAGVDGFDYLVEKVDLSGFSRDDTVEIDGSEFNISDIISLLEDDSDDEDDEYDDF